MVERDGGVCIVTNLDGNLCDAAHIIDVSKGDKYIEKLATCRSLNHPNPQFVRDVDDLQNGLLLFQMVTSFMGLSVAFLPIPNVYMTSNDVDNLPLATSSLILHDLDPPMNAPLVHI